MIMDREKKAILRKWVYGTLKVLKIWCLILLLVIVVPTVTWLGCYALIYVTHLPPEVSKENVERFKKECIITTTDEIRHPYRSIILRGTTKSIQSFPNDIVGEWEYDKYIMHGDSFNGIMNSSSFSASLNDTQNINELRKDYLDWRARYYADDINLYLWSIIVVCGLVYYIRKFFVWLKQE